MNSDLDINLAIKDLARKLDAPHRKPVTMSEACEATLVLSIDDVAPQPARKRTRKPSLVSVARLAKREGVQVAMAADGTVTMTPVKPLDIAPTDTETGNEWDTVLQ